MLRRAPRPSFTHRSSSPNAHHALLTQINETDHYNHDNHLMSTEMPFFFLSFKFHSLKAVTSKQSHL